MQVLASTNLRSICKCACLAGVALTLAACFGGGVSDDALLAQRATFRNLGFLPGYASSQASAISSNGFAVVGTSSTAAGNREAFRWNLRETMVGLGFMFGGISSMATAVSADGNVIVGTGDATTSDRPTPSAAFRWTADEGLQRVDSLPGAYLSAAGGVSGDGVRARVR